jgi:hydroxymethylglutaryl-CoA synthase
MVGIESYGAYVPMWRVKRALIANEAGRGSMGGERAVASWDEDSLTMAVEAGADCLSGCNPRGIDGIYFATVSSPFKQKQASSLIASALDLRKDVDTCDLASSTRAATAAVKAAYNSVQCGSSRKVLVIAADCRKARPRSEFEQIYGDGAAALLIGKDEVIAQIEGFATQTNPIPES